MMITSRIKDMSAPIKFDTLKTAFLTKGNAKDNRNVDSYHLWHFLYMNNHICLYIYKLKLTVKNLFDTTPVGV